VSKLEERTEGATHDVFNQSSPLEGHNVFEADRVLVEALSREGADWAVEHVSEIGRFAGSAQAQRWGREANENEPVLTTHDRFGHRIDEVSFHPAWHELMARGVGCTRCPGARLSREPTWPAPPASCASRRPRPASAARSR